MICRRFVWPRYSFTKYCNGFTRSFSTVTNDIISMMKLFVWDLHGTLEMGNEIAVIDISNKALAAHGFKERFTQADREELYGIKWKEYYAHLLPDLPNEKHVALHKTGIKIAETETSWLDNLQPTDYSFDVLAKIAKCHHQILISNTSEDHLKMYVQSLKLDKFFRPNQIYSASRYAEDTITKPEVLQQYLKGKNYEKIIAIGDTATDMEMAKAVDGIGYLYAHPGWRHQPADADYKIHDLRNVLAEV